MQMLITKSAALWTQFSGRLRSGAWAETKRACFDVVLDFWEQLERKEDLWAAWMDQSH